MKYDPKELLLGGVKTPNRNLLQHDNADDRKGIARALEVLGDDGRLLFLRWCCRGQTHDRGLRVVPNFRPTVGHGGRKSPTFYPVAEALCDLTMVTVSHGLDAYRVLAELERRAKAAR